ncbi:MAG: hypothetical protein Tsb0027_16320 [Wenzhouxiangellaceae bacterium]
MDAGHIRAVHWSHIPTSKQRMSNKIGRNEPCPCGSGRKYKQCHGKPAAVHPIAGDTEQAVKRSLKWLEKMHRKPFQREFEDLLLRRFWPEKDQDLSDISEELWGMIEINMLEWLLARGELLINDEYVVVQDLLLGPGGPRLSEAQQDYLRQFESNPLRLYAITESRPGDGLTLIDAIKEGAEPLTVQEKTGSQTLAAGDYLACRIVRVDDHLELTGAIYPIGNMFIGALLGLAPEMLQAARKKFPQHDPELIYEQWLVERWFEQLVAAPLMPPIMDASSGEPMLLVTDHYQITNRDALMARLAASDEMEETGQYSWDYLEEHDDGMTRSRLTLNFAKPKDRHPDRLSMFCRTLNLADEGRPWFEQLAGDSVRHLTRELSDPIGSIGGPDSSPRQQAISPDIDADDMSSIITKFIHKQYANWADEPIPALQQMTPREAISTASGMERVKVLLRSYQSGENETAREQGREPVSYRFLWDQLGLPPD